MSALGYNAHVLYNSPMTLYNGIPLPLRNVGIVSESSENQLEDQDEQTILSISTTLLRDGVEEEFPIFKISDQSRPMVVRVLEFSVAQGSFEILADLVSPGEDDIDVSSEMVVLTKGDESEILTEHDPRDEDK